MADTVLAVSAPTVNFVRSGGRDVDLGKLKAPALAAGQIVRMTDDAGDEVAIGVADPENQKLRVYLMTEDGFRKVDGAVLGWRVQQAFALRAGLGLPGERACYRLLHGAGDGLPGFACDVLGKFAVLYVYSAALWELGLQLAQAVQGFAKLDGVVIKQRLRGGASEVKQDVVGASPPDAYLAEELGVPYEIHPHGGLNHGLFTDMREQRRGLTRFAAGRNVLNLFSYTGALSVACARAGAATVTSVDTSDGVQAWARVNFGNSGFANDKRFRFEVGDAQRYLVRAAKDKERYDLILVDPPTFSPARGTPWALERDYPELIAQAAAVVPPGGLLWLAANTHGLANSSESTLLRMVQKGLSQAKRTAAVLEQGGLPPDYPTAAAQPKDRYLQIALLRLG